MPTPAGEVADQRRGTRASHSSYLTEEEEPAAGYCRRPATRYLDAISMYERDRAGQPSKVPTYLLPPTGARRRAGSRAGVVADQHPGRGARHVRNRDPVVGDSAEVEEPAQQPQQDGQREGELDNALAAIKLAIPSSHSAASDPPAIITSAMSC